MKTIDPGHKYALLTLDGQQHGQTLTFVKRCDAKQPWRYPGNDSAYPGTTMQSVLRAICERIRYLQGQHSCPHNTIALFCLRAAIWLFEKRAATLHGRDYKHGFDFAETSPMCPVCGHTGCEKHDELDQIIKNPRPLML